MDTTADRPRHRLGQAIVALATAIGVLAVVVALFLNPIWIAFEQERAEATLWTGYTPDQLRSATDAILVDVVIGPPDFDGTIDGQAVLDERERSHMRDVRTVFIGFFGLALVLVVTAVIVVRRWPPATRGAIAWRAVRRGATGLVIVLAALGIFALVAFDSLFEIFHQVFFAGGSYTFDPSTDRLVQLFPFQFWQETAIAVGVVAGVVAVLVAVVAHRRERRA
jgi:integral membrane protein (TIGR01906 family)